MRDERPAAHPERQLHGLRDPEPHAVLDHQPVHYHLDVVDLVAVQLHPLFDGADLAVGADALEALLSDLLEEVASVFTMLVFASVIAGVGLLIYANERWTTPARRLASALPFAAALGMALFASRITSFIVGFEFVTLLCGAAACALGAAGLRIIAQGSSLERRETLSGIALVCVLSVAGGLAHYSQIGSARSAAWSKVPLTRNLASSLATVLDGDVDGIGQGFGHPDCDDISANVYPGAREVPGNNRDDNCLGGDVSKQEVVELWSGPKAVRGEDPSPVDFDRKPYNVLFVTIDAEPEDKACVLWIEDDGMGIPEEKRVEIFDRGARLDTGKPGTGLGLAIVRDVAEIYGGAVELGESEDLGGLAVTLKLPRAG